MPEEARCLVCASADLVDRGKAFLWDVLEYGRPARAFAMRFDGQVVAYLNRCAHVPAELDWQPGEFLDASRERIVCSLHGAQYDPLDGRCVAGPGGRGRLVRIPVAEAEGRVYWYPSQAVRPVPPRTSAGDQGAPDSASRPGLP
jgi:nitrite reductase/ring-hydroxylating ferredoxin subunit